jgi:hypothetical protein
MQVTVAEQIVCVTPGACNAGNPNRVLDYQYYVVNTGLFPVDGFSVGVGNRANAIAGGENFSDLAGGGDLQFPNGTGNGVTNAINFLTDGIAQGLVGIHGPGQTAFGFQTQAPGMVDISSAGGGAWGFEEFDNNAGTNPTAYVVRWYTALQGGAGRPLMYNSNCNGNIPASNNPNTPIANGAAGAAGVANDGMINSPVVCNGNLWFFLARFDLYSARGPVPGTGAPDPIGPEWSFGFDDDINGLLEHFDLAEIQQQPDICVDGCSTTLTQQDIADFVPEPATTTMMGGALVVLALALKRFKR